MREIVLDTETTGFDPETGDRVVEIGCVELNFHVPTGNEYHCYINPERDMPEGAFGVHGLSEEFLSDKPVFADIVDDFLEFIGDDAALVIHTGGTFGVEACLLSKVCLYFDFSASNLPSQGRNPFYLNIRSVSNQYHLRKYLRLADENVINDETNLAKALEKLLINKNVDAFSEYSRNVSTMFPIRAMNEIVDDVLGTQ